MSNNDPNKNITAETVAASEVKTEHLRSTRDDEVVTIGADLIPDDIDMYPRNLGSREMPFRQVWSEGMYGSVDPIGERDCIGALKPFMAVNARTLYGNLQGTVNGLPVPGFIHGYGWILLYVFCTGAAPEFQIQRSFWTPKNYSLLPHNNGQADVLIHPQTPYMPFTSGSPVMVEIIQNNIMAKASKTSHLSLIPQTNVALKTPQVSVPVEVPTEASGQFQILIRFY